MAKLKFVIICLCFAGVFWYFYGNTLKENGIEATYHEIQGDVSALKETPFIQDTINTVQQGVHLLVQSIKDDKKDMANNTDEEATETNQDKLTLEQPKEQSFSIANIEIGDNRKAVEEQLGQPQRTTQNQYGAEWVSYHKDYHNFVMVTYDQVDQVAGLYTNQSLLSSTYDLSFEDTMDDVLKQLEQPIESINKGLVNYQINGKDEYDMFHMNQNYITFFYDVHENHTITAVQIISETLENQKPSYFATPSKELRQGLEYQLFDLTNAARIEHGLNTLTWFDQAQQTVQDHSADMAKNNYFSHTNLQGQSPFDRLQLDGITFTMAGENLATGQPSSIFAHEGLMNSMGHRENILKPGFKMLTIGVAFNDENQPFYTENFITK